MKLHNSVVNKLLRLYELHGGRRDESRLRNELAKLDLGVYQQQQNPKHESFLVLTEDLNQSR
jgi:hypothetical protein